MMEKKSKADRRKVERELSLSAWLLANTPRGKPIPLPDRTDPPRPIPFADDQGDSG